MSHHLFAILVLIIAPLTYSWRVDYSCVGCTESYYRSGTDQAQFIFSEIDYGIIGFDIWLAQGQTNTTAYRVAVLGEDISTTTYITDLPTNITSNDNYYFNIQPNTTTGGLVLGPFGVQAPQPSSSLSSVTSSPTASTSAPGSPTQSPSRDEDDGGVDTSTIVGAVVGTVGGVALIFGAIFFVRRRNKQNQQDNLATQNLMNNNYGGPPPSQPQGYPSPQVQGMQYVPPPTVTYASSPQHHSPEPPAQFHSLKPDAPLPPTGAQYQSSPKQAQFASKPQSPNVLDSPPAPPYRYQSPHVPDEVTYQSPHSH